MKNITVNVSTTTKKTQIHYVLYYDIEKDKVVVKQKFSVTDKPYDTSLLRRYSLNPVVLTVFLNGKIISSSDEESSYHHPTKEWLKMYFNNPTEAIRNFSL